MYATIPNTMPKRQFHHIFSKYPNTSPPTIIPDNDILKTYGELYLAFTNTFSMYEVDKIVEYCQLCFNKIEEGHAYARLVDKEFGKLMTLKIAGSNIGIGSQMRTFTDLELPHNNSMWKFSHVEPNINIHYVGPGVGIDGEAIKNKNKWITVAEDDHNLRMIVTWVPLSNGHFMKYICHDEQKKIQLCRSEMLMVTEGITVFPTCSQTSRFMVFMRVVFSKT